MALTELQLVGKQLVNAAQLELPIYHEKLNFMTINIRQATIADLTTLLPIVEKFYRDFDYQFEMAQHTAVVQQFMMNKQLGSLWLIDTEEACVGYLALTYGFTFGYGGRDALIDEFYIIDSYRNRGLGSAILDKIKQEVVQLGFVALNLQLESNHDRAKDLYTRAGFQDLKRKTLTWFTE